MKSHLSFLIVAVMMLAATALPRNTAVPGTILPAAGEDLPAPPDMPSRKLVSLSGEWTMRATPRPSPPLHPNDLLVPLFANTTPATTERIPVQVPGVWQNQGLGMDYHTAVEYRRTFDAPARGRGERVWLRFSRAATAATVELNGKVLGSHLGMWTPFEFDATDALSEVNELVVRVDEKPEHWAAGFIRNVHPAFGGLWGDVWLETRPQAFLSDIFIHPHPDGDFGEAWIEIGGADVAPGARIELAVAGSPAASASVAVGGARRNGKPVVVRFPAKDLARWSPDAPNMHEATLRLVDADGRAIDEARRRFGLRTFAGDGEALVLNGDPIYWGAILHWGIYPELLAPNRTREQFRAELRALKALGFNAVNVCLFVFPERFYEVADEEGVMVWQEYPLWLYFPGSIRPTSDEDKEALVAEYVEMFRLVRAHPSVVLHSMAVEDPEGDEELMRRLVDLCHAVVPRSVAQDNSAFLNQKVADFLDHHHYDELEGYRENMAAWMAKVHARDKRLLLFGEAMDFDTLRNAPAIADAFGADRPWWTLEQYCRSLMIPGRDNNFWEHEKKLRAIAAELGPGGLERIERTSREHSWLARKYQVEVSRLHRGFGGMALTALRDTICTRPGIYDDLGNLKWTGRELPRFNAQTLPLLTFDRENASYAGGETARLRFALSRFGKASVAGAALECRFVGVDDEATKSIPVAQSGAGPVGDVGTWDLALPAVDKPVACRIEARLVADGATIADNEWKVWVFPRVEPKAGQAGRVDDPANLFHADDLTRLRIPGNVLLASTLGDVAREHLRAGGGVALVDPNGTAFKSHDSPFWREVAVERFDEAMFADFPWSGAVDLPWFGLHTWKTYDPSPDRRPLFRTINCRYLHQNDMMVETTEFGGRLVATTFRLPGRGNVAGLDLLQRLVDRAGEELN